MVPKIWMFLQTVYVSEFYFGSAKSAKFLFHLFNSNVSADLISVLLKFGISFIVNLNF